MAHDGQDLARRAQWEKALWKRQAFEDNYTDAKLFLRHLEVNAAVPPRSYWPVVLSSCAVSQQLSCVAAAAAVPAHLAAGSMTARAVLVACGVLLALGYGTCALLGGHLLGGTLARGVRQCLLLVGGVYSLSPLLRSLAATSSTDSVVALAVGGAAVHLALYDYAFINSSGANGGDGGGGGEEVRLTGALSLGSGVMAAVLLASRMGCELQVFAQVLLSLELFLLSPYVRRHVRRRSRPAHVGLTAVMVAAAAGLLATLPPPPLTAAAPAAPPPAAAAAAFLAAAAAVSFAAPAALVRCHKFKAKISGPWDEAAPYIPRELVLLPPPPPSHGSSSSSRRGHGTTGARQQQQ